MKALLILALCLPTFADANIVRHRSAKAHFPKLFACPATGKHIPSCPGYVIDHVVPLCGGGADVPANMAWQTVADAKVKDLAERRQCRH